MVMAILIIGLGIALVLPQLQQAKERAQRIRCISHNKFIGTGYRVFASDNGDRYPLQAPTNSYIFQPGGSGTTPGAVVSTNAEPWQIFQAMHRELGTPVVLLCPADRARATSRRVRDFNGLAGVPGLITTSSLGHPSNRNLAISYAPQALADESRPIGVLNVDRNINFATAATASSALGAASGTKFVVNSPSAASSVFFVGGPGFGFHGMQGNVAYADGSVQQVTAQYFQNVLSNSGALYGWGTTSSNGYGAAVFLIP
jgi:prepilin-type processing-associated H-X9-DG protein